jgi:hypothetical protein
MTSPLWLAYRSVIGYLITVGLRGTTSSFARLSSSDGPL